MTDDRSWRRDPDVGRPDIPANVDAELEFHRQSLIEELIQTGMAPDAARREASRRLEGLPAVRQELVTIDVERGRRGARFERWEGLFADFRFALRSLGAHRFFTAMAVLSLGLGIGATTTILSAAHAILIRALPYPEADRLVAVYEGVADKGWHGVNISYLDYVAWKEQNHTFQDLGIYTWSTISFSGEAEAERVEGAEVSANLFPVLGISPVLGRGFTREETAPNGPRVVLLSQGLWRRRYAADPAIVGKAVVMNGRPTTVVGVMPAGFAFPDRGQAWVPFVPDPSDENRGNRGYAGAIGRLKPGATLAEARADLDLISTRLQRDFPRDNFGWAAEAMSLRDDLVGDLRRPLQIFVIAAGFVLLIVCANVANLVLARGTDRRRELAVRIAIGAGRGRLVRQLLTESIVLALAGGVIGAALAIGGLRLFRLAFPNDVPFYIRLGVDGTALAITALVSIATGILFGTAPAFRATAMDLTAALRDGQRSGEGVDRSRFRRLLVTAEFALSFALLTGAGLLIKSYRALTGTDLGFQEHGILALRTSLPAASYASPARRAVFYQAMLDRLGALPGVTSVGSAQGIPFSGWNVQSEMSVEGRPPRRQGDELSVHFQQISPGFFPTIGARIVRGRNLTAADRDSANPVGVVNEKLVKAEFAGQDPIGKRIRLGGPDSKERWVTIVGVVTDYRHYGLPQPMGPALYFPLFAAPAWSQTFVIRTTTADPHDLIGPARAALKAVDPEVPAYQIQTFDEVVSRSLWRQRLQGQTLGIFAGLALVLATVGIYGVISYSVAQRTRELGVRTALGGVLALGSARLLRGVLYGVSPTDPVVFALVFLALGLAALVACYFPARRAAAVDPVVAMRAD
jgi:putative ABC transport system permease protein